MVDGDKEAKAKEDRVVKEDGVQEQEPARELVLDGAGRTHRTQVQVVDAGTLTKVPELVPEVLEAGPTTHKDQEQEEQEQEAGTPIKELAAVDGTLRPLRTLGRVADGTLRTHNDPGCTSKAKL